MDEPRTVRGLTPTSVAASLFCLLAMGVLIQVSDVTVGVSFASEHTLALPAIWVACVVLALVGILRLLTRWHVITRAEMLCVVFCMLIGAPLMTQGFWHRIVAIVATNPRQPDFEKLDAISDRLWPHGPNLLSGLWRPGHPALETNGACRWEDLMTDSGRRARLPVLVSTGAAPTVLRLRLPVAGDGAPGVVPGEPYLISILALAVDLGPASRYACRAYADDDPAYVQFFATSQEPRTNVLHRAGFRRAGAYGVKFPVGARDHYTLEFVLEGNGSLALADPRLCSVAALEGVFRGRRLVTASEYDALPPDARAGLVVRPDRLWSLRGVAFLLAGYIPVRDWAGPVLVWTLFIGLLLTAVLAINIILRRQWLDNERFQLPMARIPALLIDDGDEPGRILPEIWRNRLMWVGFAAALTWMLLKVWRFYNPSVPDVAISVNLTDYLQNPSWGRMWQRCRFEVDGIFFALCMFMELNVLLSIVVGFLLFRSQFWIGEVTGLTADPNFPYSDAQGMGAYLGYALILIVLSRRYLWHTLRAAVTGDRAASVGEPLSYRAAYLLLFACVAGGLAWGWWMGVGLAGMLTLFLLLITLGWVAARIRAECGTPWGYFTPWTPVILLSMLGGISRFGPEAMMLCFLVSFLVGPTGFFLVPGAQTELLGLGTRWRVTPRHLVWCALLGIVGGMIIGGWVFLSNAYAVGGDNTRYTWAFDTKWWYFFPFNQDLTAANTRLLGQQAAASTGVDPAWLAFGGAGIAAAAVALLRQAFAGFWFHPVGILLGCTNFAEYIWGSALAAWVVRAITLRLGGAATVREKLQPFCVGIFLGACAAYLVVLVLGACLQAAGHEGLPALLLPPS